MITLENMNSNDLSKKLEWNKNYTIELIMSVFIRFRRGY